MALIRRSFINFKSNRIILRCLRCGGLLSNPESFHDEPYPKPPYTTYKGKARSGRPAARDSRKLMNLCVIGTGKNGTAKSFLLRIKDEGYLFNCGEGTARVLANRRLYVGINNIFFTHLNWENLGGVIGLCMTKQSHLLSRLDFSLLGLYGPASMAELFTQSRTFARFHRLEINSYSTKEAQVFENSDVHVESVIFYPKFTQMSLGSSQPISMLNLARYMKKSQQTPLSSEKEAVFYIITPKVEVFTAKKILVVDCPNELFRDGLISNERLREFYTDAEEGEESCLDLIVHLSPASVVHSDEYREWIRRFDPTTKHLLINEESPGNAVTKYESLQNLLNAVDPDIWPMLKAQPVTVSQLPLDLNVYQGSLGLFYSFMGTLEGKFYRDQKELIMMRPNSLLGKYKKELENIASQKAKIIKDYDLCSQKGRYPEVVFLGTAATRPTDIRNVACILLHISPDKAILMDCGEGAFEQLVTMYGTDGANDVLRKVKLIYITHMHPDHHVGLVTILNQRHKLRCKDLVHLIAPRVMNDWLNLIDSLIIPIQHIADFISAELFIKHSLFYTNDKQVSVAEELDLQELDIFRASHSQHPSSIAITHNDGWKVVYSGDSKPGGRMVKHSENCDLLIHEATYSDSRIGAAIFSYHSTVSEAVDMGVQGKAKNVLLTHLSPKYGPWECLPDLRQYEDQLQLAVAFDFMRVRFSQLALLPLYQDLLLRLMNQYYKYGVDLVKKMKTVYPRD
ncbi:hypothetical protein CAPTEDRAFT_218896 [Capitella teleta]|uniref:ribonuclease Z n=1 Tax=Capitella teleta TaxID=283909 RepID=R7VK60_CAPTE|nr:hypothetical protein CAPTEDRAFT_218896 [Capitella teleta]|eukprot:ELU16505.1 hypothetical protein CAPTEDRAFT_218896 [Capitella teleta]